jgi:hypothetical protein
MPRGVDDLERVGERFRALPGRRSSSALDVLGALAPYDPHPRGLVAPPAHLAHSSARRGRDHDLEARPAVARAAVREAAAAEPSEQPKVALVVDEMQEPAAAGRVEAAG